MSLLVRLACSYYYGVIFKILTGQKRDLTELKFLWPVNTTGNSPKFILSPIVRWLSAKFWRDLYIADKSTKLCMVVA